MLYLPITILSGIITDLRRMLKCKEKKYPYFIILSLMSVLALCKVFDNHLLIIKGFIFSQILLFTAYNDLRTRKIPDFVHIIIIFAGLINFEPIDSILGFFAVIIPFLLIAMLNDGGIGGGDVKLMGACGFLLGVEGGVFASIIGLTIAICFNLTKGKNTSFPLAPFIAVACFISYLIFQ